MAVNRKTRRRMPVFSFLQQSALCTALTGSAYAATVELPAVPVFGEAEERRVSRSGTRSDTPLIEVPQTVDSVNPAQAEVYGVQSLGEALVGLPNVSDAQDTRFDSVTIRGFSSSNDFYLDGMRDDSQYLRDLHSIERIEVLKGPAAALYGRGAPGGIINRISKAPRPGLESKLSTQAGSWDKYNAYLDLAGDPGETVSLRLNTGVDRHRSFRRHVHGERQLLAPAALWRITPRLQWLVQYEFNRYQRVPDRGIPGLNGRPAEVADATFYGDPARDEIDDRARSLRSRLSYQLADDWSLRHTASLFRLHSTFDNTYLSGIRDGRVQRQRWQQDLHTRNLFNTVELEGRLTTGPLEHQVLLGLELGHQERKPTLHRGANVPALALHRPDLSQQHQGPMPLFSAAQHRVRSTGIYLQDQIALTAQWRVLLGARLDQFRVHSLNRRNGKSEGRSNRSISPRLGLVWMPLPGQAAYLSYGKSYEPTGGGLIAITPGAAANSLAPQYSRQYEAGLKSDWADSTLSTTLAVYHLELYNRRTTDPANPGRTILRGLQRSRGIELTAQGKLIGNWYIRGGVGWQLAGIERDNGGAAGKRVANAARHNGSLFVGWRPAAGWFAETGLTWSGSRFADSANTVVLPGYGRWDASAGYRAAQWDARLAVRNLADRHYYRSATSANQIQPADPRAVIATLNYRF